MVSGAEFDDVLGSGAPESVGRFTYFLADDHWEWSSEVATMHGYTGDEVEPTTSLLLSHKHPDDVAKVTRLIEQMRTTGTPFSSRHRIIDANGFKRHVIVAGDRLLGDDGTSIGVSGFYIDVTDTHLRDVDESVTETMDDIVEPRMGIEQAKGALMLAYGITADRAFDTLVWRSQDANIKLRRLADLLMQRIVAGDALEDGPRVEFDHLFLTLGQSDLDDSSH